MSQVYVKNKKNGTTYVYESTNYWDKAKKQSRSKRVCIGKLDEAGQLITSKRLLQPESEVKPGPVVAAKVSRFFYGSTYLLDSIGTKVGIDADLKTCFPDSYKQILSLAYYLVLESDNPMSRFPRWQYTHKHPYGKDIPSQRSSELLKTITEADKQYFFRLQAKRRLEREYLAYDITSISSYSESLKQVKYGNNKDHDPLPQINLALLFGEQSNLPFYYRKLPGNIPDVKTLQGLLADMNQFQMGKIKLVMDRGFYSEKNINGLYQNHLKFLVSTKLGLKYVQQELDKVRSTFRTRVNYVSKYQIYTHTAMIEWNYEQERPYKQDILVGKRRIYLHLYYSRAKALEHEERFNATLDLLEEELKSGKRNPEHERQYLKYFDISTTPVRGTKITVKQDAVDKVERNYGFFALLSNDVNDPVQALELYRNKDLVEKAFGNLKERLNMRRTTVSSESALEGKLFIQFVALIYLSYLKKQMETADLFGTFTLQGVLDELDVIEAFEEPGFRLRLGEMTNKQAELYKVLGINPPTSL